ncbi:uncharacterized protein LOC129695550 [Leucoraja erinacea]|uniref:uncharacterized protein LOC129695550 n=1 Tax=Leucoraja erinaceus TaxID=7782 RepID=UPI0024578F74|nr:uncharacterized protein LOC129695550 [Leucoraja erinacea]
MTDSALPIGLLATFVIAFCRSQDNTTSQTEMFEENNVISTAHSALDQNNSEYSSANASFSHSERVTPFFNKTKAVTKNPLHTYLPSQSSVPETPWPSEKSKTVTGEVNKETSKPKENFASKDEVLDSQSVTGDRSVVNSLEYRTKTIPTLMPPRTYITSTGNTCINQSDVSIFGIKAWKFGLISAALPIFLIVEALALAIYCTKCKKRGRYVTSAKTCEDSEAAETINAESNENTVTMNNMALTQINNPLEI